MRQHASAYAPYSSSAYAYAYVSMRQHTHTSAYLRAVQVPPRHVDVVYETHEQLPSGRAYEPLSKAVSNAAVKQSVKQQ